MVKEIQTKKNQEEEREKNLEFNNKFTLMYQGKAVMKEKDKEDLIEYLENFIPSDKKLSSVATVTSTATATSFEQTIIKYVKPIFDNFDDVKKIYIAYWGRYFKYELAGQNCDINYECEDKNLENIDEETWREITELYEDNLCPDLDEKKIKREFGWPDRGGIILGVKRKKGELEVFTEDYEFE